jgi:phage tail sheath protein FI
MPEYLAPGVYVEEVSFRSKSIEGVSTTTTGFVGPARYGPTDLEPELLTSLGEFERIYGDGQPLRFANLPDPMTNYLWQAVRAFFEEGGKRLYVVRVFQPKNGSTGAASATLPKTVSPAPVAPDLPANHQIQVRARFPGAAGKRRVRFTASLGQNILGQEDVTDPLTGSKTKVATVRSLRPNDVVWITDIGAPYGSPISTHLGTPISPAPTAPLPGKFYLARREPDPTTGIVGWFFYAQGDVAGSPSLGLVDLDPRPGPMGDQVRVATLTVTVYPTDPSDLSRVWSDLPLDPAHTSAGTEAPDSLADVFAAHPAQRSLEHRLPIVVELGDEIDTGLDVVAALDAAAQELNPDLQTAGKGIFAFAVNPKAAEEIRSFEVLLDGGDDGNRPGADQYEGKADPDERVKTGLKALEDIDDISIVAAPGATYRLEEEYHDDALAIVGLLISHAERMRYRIAVLDAGDEQSLTQIRAMKAKLDSKYAALYYPWVRVLDPVSRREISLPPSGFVTGIYARNDIERAVYKAPANEVVRLALGFELLLNKAQQDVLNPEGINCFRFFEGRGYRLWGARTISSDPEWKYVNLRRYFAYLEHSIDRGTQWAVFEPNGEALWANVRRTIEDFLLNEWQSGALLGDKPEKAFFVRCDRSTMTQNDLDNGRLVCLIGVVPLRPAEFVIFRIGQATADSMRRG